MAQAMILWIMNTQAVDRFIRASQARALIGLPAIWLLMFAMHFRSLADFFVLRLRYEPVPAQKTVAGLIAAQNHWPMIHDPHVMGYLSLPLLALGGFGLYSLGRTVRPALAALGVALTVTGCIYLGGVFGLYTALYRGLGSVEPKYLEGAVATFTAVTANQGAYGMTRALAELALLGIAVQSAALWNARGIPRWAPALVMLGCGLFLAFWDVDNLMFAGAICLLAGFVPLGKALREAQTEG
jgi:hypothetical protein